MAVNTTFSKLAITCGDTAGIGPEVIVKSLKSQNFPEAQIIVIGPFNIFSGIGNKFGLHFTRINSIKSISDKGYFLLDIPENSVVNTSIESLDKAIELGINKSVSAIVTAPVSKSKLSKSGFNFIGHTEYLARKCNVRDYAMMFSTEIFDTVLVTTHKPVREISNSLSKKKIVNAGKLLHNSMKIFRGLPDPRIAVSALNPHTGDEGLFGTEEKEIIAPAIKQLTKLGIICAGPFSADTIFIKAIRGEFDGLLMMYHDQALGVIKTMFPKACNVTLGLPFIRTSPDHGTAFDIAGKFRADETPMVYAIQTAIKFARTIRNKT